MIVRHTQGRLLCLSQPDHAALAGRLAEAWAADGLPNRPTRGRVLQAVRQHDLGWTLEDQAVRFDTATHGPHSFVTAPGAWDGAFPRGARTEPRGPLRGLVAQHAVTGIGVTHDPAGGVLSARKPARRPVRRPPRIRAATLTVSAGYTVSAVRLSSGIL